jgi:hypothetical protein
MNISVFFQSKLKSEFNAVVGFRTKVPLEAVCASRSGAVIACQISRALNFCANNRFRPQTSASSRAIQQRQHAEEPMSKLGVLQAKRRSERNQRGLRGEVGLCERASSDVPETKVHFPETNRENVRFELKSLDGLPWQEEVSGQSDGRTIMPMVSRRRSGEAASVR